MFVFMVICCPQTLKKCLPSFCTKRPGRTESLQTNQVTTRGISLDSEGVNAFRVGTNNAIEAQQFEMVEELPLVRATRTVVVRDRSANPNRRR